MPALSVSQILASRNKQIDHDPTEVTISPLLTFPLELRRQITLTYCHAPISTIGPMMVGSSSGM